jgi:tRNA pseudouridine38-40 synthase
VTLFGPEEPPVPLEQGTPVADEPVRIRLTVAYDGTGFHGFAAQPGQTTVGGTLGSAIEKVVGHPVRLTCAGRTDAGVHAWGQVVHADVAPARGRLDLAALVRSCNAMLAPAIVVRDGGLAAAGFDARHSAISRRYRYSVLNSATPDPFLATTAWHVEDPLDLRAMEQASDPLLGEHDFSTFCRRPPDGGSLVRRVLDARWTRGDGGLGEGDLLRFEIEAGAFCHQMVRSVVGTLVEVGRGRKQAGDLTWILRACDRSLAGSPAPPHGLCLWAVSYGSDGAAPRASGRDPAAQRASSTLNP